MQTLAQCVGRLLIKGFSYLTSSGLLCAEARDQFNMSVKNLPPDTTVNSFHMDPKHLCFKLNMDHAKRNDSTM